MQELQVHVAGKCEKCLQIEEHAKELGIEILITGCQECKKSAGQKIKAAAQALGFRVGI